MKKLIKENKVLFVLSIVIIISLVLMVIGLLSYFYGNEDSAYGNRLNEVNKYPISKKIDKQIKSLYETGVEDLTVDVRGPIVYILIDVNPSVSKEDAKSMAVKALDKFSEEEKSVYDIAFQITCKTASEDSGIFPIEGTKKAKKAKIVWTNN